jgi:tRNA threonylcarbamoyladenosine biosynthesis protein TsaB
MARILHIDTGGNTCSVAISERESLLAFKESKQDRTHAAQLTVLIDSLLKENAFNFSDLSAIAVSMGPGSYTGLRIGVSTAKGICFGTGLPLIAVPSLESMCYGVMYRESAERDEILRIPGGLLCPMIDARRLEVYTGMFDCSCKQIADTHALVIDGTSFTDLLENNRILFFGSGADKTSAIIKSKNALFMPNFSSTAQDMILIAWNAFQSKKFADVAYFEPYYLKEFIATIPRKNIFRGS